MTKKKVTREVSIRGITYENLKRRADKLGRKLGGEGGIVDDLINQCMPIRLTPIQGVRR